MYDDAGVKFQVTDPYQVTKLQAISGIRQKVSSKQEDEQKQKRSTFQEHLSSEAKNVYKQMANIHIDEEILHAYQLMSTNVVTVKATDSIYDCWVKMNENNLKQMPVLGFDDELKGLATISNIAKAMIENQTNTSYINVTPINSITMCDIMTAEPISDIRRVAKVMVQYHLNTIPIVDGTSSKVVGILSRADILRAVSTHPHFQLWA